MKKPCEHCEHCPYRNDVKPFLTPERGEELAYHAQNKYNSFPCHKTTISDEDDDSGQRYAGEKSKECAGFMTLQINEGMRIPDGFEPAYEIVYTDASEMIYYYDNPDE